MIFLKFWDVKLSEHLSILFSRVKPQGQKDKLLREYFHKTLKFSYSKSVISQHRQRKHEAEKHFNPTHNINFDESNFRQGLDRTEWNFGGTNNSIGGSNI
jgi:hypothetical protein